MNKIIFLVIFLTSAIFSTYAVDIYRTETPLIDKPMPKILPLIIKAKQIVGTKGHWDSQYDPDFYHFIQKALIDVEMTNGSNRYFRKLHLIYFIYAKDQATREVYLAGIGEHRFSLKKLESHHYRTDGMFFEGVRTAYEYLSNYRAGDKYYGYIIGIWSGEELVGFHANPRGLSKRKEKINIVRKNFLLKKNAPAMPSTTIPEGPKGINKFQ